MKIFHVISARSWGGGEVYVMSLAKEQQKHGHQVEIISPNRPIVVNKFIEAGFKVHVMQMHGHFNPLTPYKIAAMLSKQPETIVHVHRLAETPIIAKAIKKICKTKRPGFICTHHLTDPARPGKKFDKVYTIVDRFICVSNKSKEGLLSSDTAIVPDKVRVIHNSIKITAVVTDTPPDENKPLNILYVGRIAPEKGLDTAIEALAYFPETSLSICGTGAEEYVTSLHDLARRLNIEDRINWIGFTDNPTDYIARADIGIAPSRWIEAFGLVIIEFMAMGVPVVTTNNGAQPEIITDGVDGLLVPPDDPVALANAVRELIDDPALRKKMGEAARKTFEDRFTYDKFYKEVMDVYNEALSSKNCS